MVMRQDVGHEAAADLRKARVRQRWKAAALKETQRIRVEQLREQQAKDAREAERKKVVSTQLEQELHDTLDPLSWEAMLSHFGVASYKQALIKFHPDRAPPGASFEEIVRQEAVFKYVQMRHDRAGSASLPRDQPRSRSEADAWRGQQTREAAKRAKARQQAAAEEAERRRNAVPENAVLRVTAASWCGDGQPPTAGPLGYYAVDSDGNLNGRPTYRKIPPVSRASWAPWAEKAALDELENVDQIWWQGFWRLGHRRQERLTYMAASADDRPPALDWDVVDTREAEPCFVWLTGTPMP